MFNLIKAQQYRTLRDYATYITIFVGALFYICLTLGSVASGKGAAEDASHLFLMSATGFSFVGNMLTMALTVMICGSDMLDRTMNIELLDGAKRSKVFFSRFIVSLCWSLGVLYAIVFISMGFMTVVTEWGSVITVGGFFRRMAVLTAPYIRIVALYTALTFIIGDWRAVFAIGFVINQVELVADMLLMEITKLPPIVRAILSVPAVNVMIDVDNMGFDYIDAKDVQVVKDSLTVSDNIICIVICAAMAALLLAAGLAVFRKKDLK